MGLDEECQLSHKLLNALKSLAYILVYGETFLKYIVSVQTIEVKQTHTH